MPKSKDWRTRLDDFLRFNDRDVLPNAGRVSREIADQKAGEEFERFAARRRAEREANGEAEMLRGIEDAVKKLPRAAKPRKKSP